MLGRVPILCSIFLSLLEFTTIATPASPQALTVESLPLLVIEVNSQPIRPGFETPGRLRVLDRHHGRFLDLETSPATLETPIRMEVRGDSTVTLDKKSYDLELTDAAGRDRAQPLIGMPAGSDWVLHGCGKDATCMRNALVYTLVRESGRYAPRVRFIELFLDGSYRGLYVLMEKVRRGVARVDLPRPADALASGDISGGYIFRMDLGQGTPADVPQRDWISAVTPMVYSYYYPRFDDITDAQKSYLHDYMARFEQMMQEDSWNHGEHGYPGWLDVPSWVDFALFQELSLNVDAYLKSIYLQKWPQALGGRLALGPVWDFDSAFGLADFRGGREISSWAFTMNRFGMHAVSYDPPGAVPNVPAYWERLWAEPAFQQRVRCRWQSLRQGPLRIASVIGRIDSWTSELRTAYGRDAAVWNRDQTDEHLDDIAALKSFIERRIVFMDANLPGACPAS